MPFGAVISIDKAIQKYSDVLAEEAGEAIMSWIIEGAVKFCKNDFKLDIPGVVLRATQEYRTGENGIAAFIDECCTKEGRTGGRALYTAYKQWTVAGGKHVPRESDFIKVLEAEGYQKVTSKGRKFWKGISLGSSLKSLGI